MSLSSKLKNFRFTLWQENPVCFVCGKKIENYADCSLEHVVPKSLGGSSKKRNLAISHSACNNLKKNIRCRLLWENQDLIPLIAKPPQWLKTTAKQMIRAWNRKYLSGEGEGNET